MKYLTAFILAAGLGERLRPITDHIPKPLLPILGRPVIESVAERLDQIGPETICINMHHKWEQISNWAKKSRFAPKTVLFHEKERLGTGGAFLNAESGLKGSHFIAHNADIISDIDLRRLLEIHLSSGNIATLAIHNHERFNNIWIDNNGYLKYVGIKGNDSGLCKMAFTGIAVYSPQFMEFLPEGASSVVDAWMKAVKTGHAVGTVDYTGCRWTDIGTPDAYAEAVFDILHNDGEAIYIGNGVSCCDLDLAADVVIEEGAGFEGPASIERSIILPGAIIKDNAKITDSIEGPDFSIPFGRRLIDPGTFHLTSKMTMPEITEIGAGGSDRRYYRVQTETKSRVLMKCSEKDKEFQRHIALTRFLKRYDMPVPELIEEDPAHKEALLEDLGDMTLYSWLKCSRRSEEIEDIYRKVMEIAATLHSEVTKQMAECECISERVFDIDHFRWETDYFLDRFVIGLLHININDREALAAELESLATHASSFNATIVHRDFQSQNIMIYQSKPKVIDYQGIRLGPPAYDIASMLWDPYYKIDKDMRERLIDHYVIKRRTADQVFDEKEFRDSLLPCRMQRHMQALGAYGFLSAVKGKLYFRKHIPLALEYLKEEVNTVRDTYRLLHALTVKL